MLEKVFLTGPSPLHQCSLVPIWARGPSQSNCSRPPAISRPTPPLPRVLLPTTSSSAPCHPYPLPAPSPKGRVFSHLLPHWHGSPLCSLCSLSPQLYSSAAVNMSYRLHHRPGSNESTASPSPSHHHYRARGPSPEPTKPQCHLGLFLHHDGLTQTAFSS
jgi:hypothetical protein